MRKFLPGSSILPSEAAQLASRFPGPAPCPIHNGILTGIGVHHRREVVGKNNQELASLEARIREMEDRLRRNKDDTSAQSPRQSTNVPPPPPPKDDNRSRPGTARAPQQAPSSGNMPPTPGASEGDYYLVTQADLDDAPR
jgi:hypothetical protein